MLSSSLSFFMLSCTSSFHLHVSLSPFRFPNITPSTVSAVFLSISAVLSHLSGNPSLPPKTLVTSYLNASSQLVSFTFHHRIFGFTFSAFFFFTMRAIFHITIRCCLATHSFTITVQSHISFKFLFLHIT